MLGAHERSHVYRLHHLSWRRDFQDALTAQCSQLPFIKFEKPKGLIGKNTVECMYSGVLYSNAATIDGLIDRIADELGEPVTAIVTGGGAA